jgi:flagellar protein FliO/FliZ
MKRSLFFFVLLFYLFSFQPTIFAAGPTTNVEPSVYDTIQKGHEKSSPPSKKIADSQTPSIFPLFIKFIVSFILVIGLMIVLLRFLSKRSRISQSNGLVLQLGGQVFGNNRSMQVVLIGQTIYIIGVGETISLIRSISQGEEYQHLLESYENQAEGLSSKWLTKDYKKSWNSVFRKHMQNMHQENGEEQEL